MNSFYNIALYIINQYNNKVNKVFPTYCKDFDCGAEDFYLTKTNLIYLLMIVQGLYFDKYKECAFYEIIFVSDKIGNKFEINIASIDKLFKPLVSVKDNKIFLTEKPIPYLPNKELLEIIDKVLDTWGGYEEWYIKSVIKKFDSVREAKENGTFKIDVPTLAVDIRFAHNKESQGRWEDDEW